MRYLALLIVFCLTFYTCNSSQKDQNPTNEEHTSNPKPRKDQPNIADKNSTIIFSSNSDTILNTSNVSNSFVQQINLAQNNANITLDGKALITNNGDRIPFPNFPSINEEMKLSGKNHNVRIRANLKRLNLSSIEFHILLEQTSGESCTYKGIADLSPYFYLGSESDEDDKSGISYLSTEFSTPENEYGELSIRIGQTEDGSKTSTLAKLKIDCKDACSIIDLNNGPTLRN